MALLEGRFAEDVFDGNFVGGGTVGAIADGGEGAVSELW